MDSTSDRRKLFKDQDEARDFVGACGLRWVGSCVRYFDETDSTNTQARRLARLGRPDGTLVLAEYQTRGRGRLGRRWVCPARAGLLVSALVDRSHCGGPGAGRHLKPQWLTAAGALAMAEAAGRVCGREVSPRLLIEWPNDIVALVGDEGDHTTSKLGGVLVERQPGASLLVLGVGLNVDTREGEFPAEIARAAGSVFTAFGVTPDRREVLARFLRGLEERLADVERLPRELGERSATLGREVTMELDGRPRRARAIGFDEEMRLVVELPDGRVEAVASPGVPGSAPGRPPTPRPQGPRRAEAARLPATNSGESSPGLD